MAKTADVLIKRANGDEINISFWLRTWLALANGMRGVPSSYDDVMSPKDFGALAGDATSSIKALLEILRTGTRAESDAAIAGFSAAFFGMKVFMLDNQRTLARIESPLRSTGTQAAQKTRKKLHSA